MNWEETCAKMWEEIITKIRDLRDTGYTIREISKQMGLKSHSGVAEWEKGKKISYNTSFSELMGYLETLGIDYMKYFPEKKLSNDKKEINIFDTAGSFQPVDIQNSEPICKVLLPEIYTKGCDFAVKIKGNSMNPYAPNGSIVGISTKCDFVLGEVYLTFIKYQGSLLKRILRNTKGNWILRSDNLDKSAYPDIDVEIKEKENFIIGKSIWVLKKT